MNPQVHEALSDLLHELFDRAPVGVAILDTELRYRYVNEALAKINRVPAEEHLDRTIEEVIPHVAPQAREAFEGVLEAGEPLRHYELSGETEDGTSRHCEEDVYPLFDADGESVIALGVIMVEVTERKRAEDRLRASERRFRTLVEAMDDVVFALDREQRHTGVWGRWLSRDEFAPEDFLGKTPSEFLGPEKARIHEEHAARALRGEHTHYEWSSEDGREFQTYLSPLADDGEVEGVVGVGRDITELRRAQAQLDRERRRAQDLLGRLEEGLTPGAVPTPGWRYAWRYAPVVPEMLLGGDFLGLATAPDGSLAFVLGDVVGHGPTSAGLGAAMLAGWEALIAAGLGPAATLPALERLLTSYGEAEGFATVCCGRLDAPGSLTLASAGHHPPLVIGEDVRPLRSDGGPALGIGESPSAWPERSHRLEPGEALLVFTDGVFEIRCPNKPTERLGYERLTGMLPLEHIRAGQFEAGLDQLLARVHDLNRGPLDDDLAVLLLAPEPGSAPGQG